jgi:hypothetical protein
VQDFCLGEIALARGTGVTARMIIEAPLGVDLYPA